MPTTPKKKNPTTIRKTIDGTTTVYKDPETGIKHVKIERGSQITYYKYNKDGSFAGGNTQNTSVFGAKDGGKRIPITPAQYKKEVEAKGKREMEEEYGKDYVIKNKKEVKKENKKEIKKEIVNPLVKKGTGQNVAELWKKTTGTSWSEAKKQGLTDGSLKSNLALMAKLKSGDYKPKAKVETKVETKVEAKPEFKISSNIKPDEVGPYYSKDKVEDPNKGKMGPIEDPNKPKLKRGGSIKSNITAIKSKIKAKIKSKIMAIKKPLLKAQVGMSTPMKMKMGGAKKYLLGGTTGTGKKLTPTTTKNNGAKSSKEPILKKAMYGSSMKPMTPMMKMGGSTLKKAMYGKSMMKPTMMKKGGTTKKK